MFFNNILATILLISAIPVSRQYVDTATNNAVNAANAYTDERLREFSRTNRIDKIYDNVTNSTFILNATGELFRVENDVIASVPYDKFATTNELQNALKNIDTTDIYNKIEIAKTNAIRESNTYTDEKIKMCINSNRIDKIYDNVTNSTFILNATGELFRVENDVIASVPYDKFATTNELQNALKNIDTTDIYNKIEDSRTNSITISKKYTDDNIQNITLLYDGKNLPPKNALDSEGRIYKVTTERVVGGKWTIGQIVEERVVTYEANYISNNGIDFIWKNNDIEFNVVYCMTNGMLVVTNNYDQLKVGAYYCGTYNNPLRNQLTEFKYVSGYKFSSLEYITQGELIVDDVPYKTLIDNVTYYSDRSNTVTSINGKKGAVVLDILDAKEYAKKTYVDDGIDSAKKEIYGSVFTDDAYSRQYTDVSIPGRINILEQTTKKQQQSMISYIWSEDFKQVMNAYGEVFDTIFEAYGHWERTTISEPDKAREYYNIATNIDNLFIWKSSSNNSMTYCPTNGEVRQDTVLLGYAATNLNPQYSHELGSFTNETTRNILKFVKRGYMIPKTRRDVTFFSSQLASSTVTGLNYDNQRYSDGSLIYSRGNVILPDYKKDYNDKFLTKDLDSDWTKDATDKSLIGIVQNLRLGGQSITTNLNRMSMSDYVDEIAKTNDSIVGTLYRINNSYVDFQTATNIADARITSTVDNKFVKGIGFYDTNEVDTLIAKKLDDTRIKYLYDDIDNPTQVSDSKGRLYEYGIEDFGGYFVMTTSAGGTANLGKYSYAGFHSGTNSWTNANLKVIWYDPITGVIGDPDAVYEGSESSKGLNPEQGDAIPDIRTETNTAKFYKQESTEKKAYSKPYDRFALNSEVGTVIDEKIYAATNHMPTMYLAESSVTRQFNPYFKVSKNFSPGTDINTYVKITATDTIQIPIDTTLFSDIELSFKAKIPYLMSSTSYNYIQSSNENILPSFGLRAWRNYYIDGYLYIYYPDMYQKMYSNIEHLLQNDVIFTMKLAKGSGPMTMSISNTVNNANCSYTGFVNTDRSKDDYLTIKLDSKYTYPYEFMLNVDSLVLKLDNTEERLIGQYANEYKKVNKLYADKQLGNANGIKLELATPEKYGMVKPDGETIKIDYVTGKLYAENTGGGASTEEIVGMMSKTNIVYFTFPSTNSVVGKVLLNEQAITNLIDKVNNLSTNILEQLNTYNTRLEKALNGN